LKSVPGKKEALRESAGRKNASEKGLELKSKSEGGTPGGGEDARYKNEKSPGNSGERGGEDMAQHSKKSERTVAGESSHDISIQKKIARGGWNLKPRAIRGTDHGRSPCRKKLSHLLQKKKKSR